MPGKKKGKSKKKPSIDIKRELEYKADGQEYAKVTKMLGNCRVSAVFPDQKTTLVHIPGKFSGRRRCMISVGDILIVCIRSFQDGRTDMAYKYNTEEVRTLRHLGEIPPFFLDREAVCDLGDDDEIEWVRDDGPVPQQRPGGTGMSDISSDESEDESEDENKKIDVDDI
jgi:translation initiation factor 1A